MYRTPLAACSLAFNYGLLSIGPLCNFGFNFASGHNLASFIASRKQKEKYKQRKKLKQEQRQKRKPSDCNWRLPELFQFNYRNRAAIVHLCMLLIRFCGVLNWSRNLINEAQASLVIMPRKSSCMMCETVGGCSAKGVVNKMKPWISKTFRLRAGNPN